MPFPVPWGKTRPPPESPLQTDVPARYVVVCPWKDLTCWPIRLIRISTRVSCANYSSKCCCSAVPGN